MPGDLEEENGRERCALLEYRRPTPRPPHDIVERELGGEGLSVAMTMIAAHVVTVPPNDDDGRLLHNDQRRAMIVRAVAVVVRVSVSMIVGTADDDMTRDVRVSKADRHTDPRLGLRHSSYEPEQQADKNGCAFHGYLLGRSLRKRHAR